MAVTPPDPSGPDTLRNLPPGALLWLHDTPPSRDLRRGGFRVLEFDRLARRVARIAARGGTRSSLGNPADPILREYARHARVAVVGVRSGGPADLRVLYGYVLEPAFRAGCALVVAADTDRGRFLAGAGPDAGWRHPWTAERCRHLLARWDREGAPARPVTPRRRFALLPWRRGAGRAAVPGHSRLDAGQAAAVLAGDGVVQVIAPAGSGKTTVLVERVKELRRRGTPADRILCLSFNRDAKEEIGARLERAGVAGVEVRSFHGLGLAILQEEGRARGAVGEVDDADLGALADGVAARLGLEPWEPARVRDAVSGFKLAAMVTPAEALAAAAPVHPDAGHAAALYVAYEDLLARRGRLDFDDLVARAVRLLQDDAGARRRWQARFARVLVDEYQDIEPAQALLVGLLAAPEDSLFCVGDEDQCIYAWRRATVRRIIELDQVYPGLERHALARNYRCGRRIVTASRRLIEHNRVRFRKPLQAGRNDRGDIVVGRCRDRREAAALVAWLISDADPGACAVLARTARLLAEVADACPGEPPVELATIHAAKGREWDRVILYGVDEGQAPHRSALGEDGGLEDERRLFYVALTRARSRLEIVCTRGRESRFLAEAGLR